MTSRVRTFNAFFLVLAFVTSGVGVCAGWQGSAEARLACCQADADCPMHAKPHGQTVRAPVSQIDADSCCASAERGGSTPSASVVGVTLAVLANSIPATGPDVTLFRDARSARPSIDVNPIPRHLLLSVFLI